MDQKEVTRDIRKYFEVNENNLTYQNLYNTVKAVLRGIFIVKNAPINKEERS